jgi:hypothetical protein
MTFTIETVDGLEGIWLCANDLHKSTPLAHFIDEDSIKLFNEIFTSAQMVAHTKGAMGI